MAMCTTSFSFGDAKKDDNPLDETALEEIKAVMTYVAAAKEEFDMKEVDFSNLIIGNAVRAYECQDNNVLEILKYYPIYNNKMLLGFVLTPDGNHFQFENYISGIVNESNITMDKLAFIFDRDALYAFNGQNFVKLYNLLIPVDGRDLIDYSIANTINIETCGNYENLVIDNNEIMAAASTYYSVSVTHRTQQPYGNICWAASTAMIANTLNGTSKTAVQVAKAYYGNTNFNKTLVPAKVAQNMRDNYNLLYAYRNRVLTDSTLLKNIRNGYPVYGRLTWGGGGTHGTVICGINSTSGYITIRDPLMTSGTATGYYNGSTNRYTYTTSSGSTGSYNNGICKSW